MSNKATHKEREEPFILRMNFNEALTRFSKVPRSEVEAPHDLALEKELKEFHGGGKYEGDVLKWNQAIQPYLKKYGRNEATTDYLNELYTDFLNSL